MEHLFSFKGFLIDNKLLVKAYTNDGISTQGYIITQVFTQHFLFEFFYSL